MEKRDYKPELLFLCVSHMLLHVYTNLPFALLPILISEYGLSILIVSIIVSIPRACSLVFSVPSGLLSDRLGPAKLISFSLFLEGLAASLILSSLTMGAIVICFSLTALASTLYHPPALSATSNISPSDFLSRGLGFHAAGGTLGISLGPITLGLVLNWFNWRYVYLVWIVPIFAVAVLALFVNVGEPLHKDRYERKGKSLTRPLRDVLSITFLTFLLLMLFRSAADEAISTYLTTYLTKIKRLEASLASIIFGLNSLIGLAGVTMGGYAGDRLGWRKSLTLIISMVSITLYCMFISASTIQTALCYLIYGFFNIMTMPITTSLVARIIPQKSRGTAFSLQFVPLNIIGIAMPMILAMSVSILEIWIIFPIAIAFYIIALIVIQSLKMNVTQCAESST